MAQNSAKSIKEIILTISVYPGTELVHTYMLSKGGSPYIQLTKPNLYDKGHSI